MKVSFFLRDLDEGPEQGKLWVGAQMETGTKGNPNCGHNTGKKMQQYDGKWPPFSRKKGEVPVKEM